MASRGKYDALQGITDPKQRAAIKLLVDRITTLETQAERIGQVSAPLAGTLDAGGHFLSSVKDAVLDDDAVNLRQLRQLIQSGLAAAPATPPPRGFAPTGGTGSKVTVPNVVGHLLAGSTTALQLSGLTVGTVTSAPSSSFAAGIVMGQSPAAGTAVTPGSAVNLTVSSGAATGGAIPVPNVIGLSQSAASTAITAALLTVGGISLVNSSLPAGTVVSETPAAGTLVAASTAVSLVLAVAPSGGGSGNIRVAGKTFRRPDGTVYRWASATDFLLFKRYLDGENIDPILTDRTGEGASMVRVLGMCTNITLFNPSSYPSYLSALPDFAGKLATFGLDLEFVVFADAQNLPNYNEFSEQRDWLPQVAGALSSSPNAILELVNEYAQNGVDPSVHSQPGGILSAKSSGDDETPNLPPWDYATFHAPRDNEWPRKSKNAMDIADFLGRPVINDEPIGAAEAAIPGSRSDQPNDFYWFAAVGMLLAGGGTFHSQDGLTSVPWGPVQRACAQAFYAGINVIPLDITTGQYTRGPLPECPIQHDDAKAIRTYAKIAGNQAVCVAVRTTAAWTAIPIAPWTITSQTGPNSGGGGSVVFLSR